MPIPAQRRCTDVATSEVRQRGRMVGRAIGLMLGLFLAAFEGLALVKARAAPAVATADVSATILAPLPVVNVLETMAPELSSTGAVLIHMGAATMVQVPKAPDAVNVDASPASSTAAVINTRDGDGTLRGDGMTVAVSASPVSARPKPAGGHTDNTPDAVNVLVEFN